MSLVSIAAAKANFFDRKAIVRAVGKARSRILNEEGRMVRKEAQKSLVYRQKAAPAGSPPSAHRTRSVTRKSRSSGRIRRRSVSLLREFLFYSFDPSSQSVVIGPVRLGNTVDPGSLEALEYGGRSSILDHGKKTSVRISAHPFMRPALKRVTPQFLSLWRDSVR